jgi:ArsR family transcriptional regulator
MSQHLSMLYRAGVLGKRRDATQIYYRIESERAAMLCRAVCTQIAVEMDAGTKVPAAMRLTPRPNCARG